MNKIANDLISKYDIDPDSLLGRVVVAACQPTQFSGKNMRANQRIAGRALQKFRGLVAEAKLVGVDAVFWPKEKLDPKNVNYRELMCVVLDEAIDYAKRGKFVAVRDQDYTLAEMRRIAARSGSRFFKSIEKGERVSKVRPKILRVQSRKPDSFYEFNPTTGDFEYISSALPAKNGEA